MNQNVSIWPLRSGVVVVLKQWRFGPRVEVVVFFARCQIEFVQPF